MIKKKYPLSIFLSRNANDMIKSLTLTMNKIRQAAITKELLEIITATEALSK